MEVQNGSILCQVPIKEGNESPEDDYDEEQAARHHRDLPDLRDQDVQNRQSQVIKSLR